MFETYFIFRQQKIEFKPISGMINDHATMQQDVLLHFWVIFLSNELEEMFPKRF